jgi:hypothetical protein
MKAFFTLGFLFASTLAQAELHVIRGTHFDQDYEVAMSDEYEDVHGSWGESRFDLTWDPYDFELKGKTAGEPQILVIDTLMQTIDFTSYCGWGDLKYSQSAPWRVWGTLCLKNIDITFDSLEASHEWLKSELLSRVVSDFPEPARAPVQKFLSGLVRFN